jgi:hypothetical protein
MHLMQITTGRFMPSTTTSDDPGPGPGALE